VPCNYTCSEDSELKGEKENTVAPLLVLFHQYALLVRWLKDPKMVDETGN